eukprot:SAG31_NODE_22498_length_524_cov_1.009412_2_plen_64_part_01
MAEPDLRRACEALQRIFSGTAGGDSAELSALAVRCNCAASLFTCRQFTLRCACHAARRSSVAVW